MMQQILADTGNTAGTPADAPTPKPKPVVPGTPTPTTIRPPQPAVAPVAPTAPIATVPPVSTPVASPVASPVSSIAPMVAPAPQPAIVGPTSVNADGNTFYDGTLNPALMASEANSGAIARAAMAPSPQTAPAPQAPIPQAAGVNLSAIDPSNDLRGELITPGPATDRYGIAQQQLQTYNQATDPLYQQALREATSQAAGAGRLGSGMLRTSLGDLANQRQNDLETQGQTFLTNALNGSIEDAYNNLGIAQQQQGRQDAAQNTAFGQGVTQTELQDALANSATNRALAQLTAGNQGNPADTDLILSQLFGNQATGAGSALNSLIGNTVNNNSQTSQTNALQAILAQLGLGGGVSTPGTLPQGTVAPDNIGYPSPVTG